MAFEAEKVDCDFLKANRIGYTENPQTGDKELTLGWTKVHDTRKQSVLDYLNSITTVTDQKYDSAKATAVGLWRNAGAGWNAQSQTYYLILRFGWAATTPENEAVYVNLTRSNQSGKLTLVRKWQFIDPGEIEKLLKSQNANPKVMANVVLDPIAGKKADGNGVLQSVTYEGEWLAISTEGPKSVQDGCTIIQTLIKAGDANLTVILGTNKTTSSRECYKWQTTEADIEAFRTHTGVYAGEFDYKWGVNEVGIQKDWQPSQAGDMSLNLVARYIVKEPWFYPANGTDFVIVSNLNGIYTESVRKFKNTTLPAANVGELVKALEDELGQFSGEVIKRDILNTGGTDGVFISTSAAVYEWNRENSDARFPILTTSTNSETPQRITGYNVWKMVCPFRRKVRVKIERRYYSTMPSASIVDDSEFIAANADYVDGGGVAITNNVIEIQEGLYAIETKTFTTSDWEQKPVIPIPLYSTPAV